MFGKCIGVLPRKTPSRNTLAFDGDEDTDRFPVSGNVVVVVVELVVVVAFTEVVVVDGIVDVV